MGHFFRVRESVTDELQRTVEPSLVACLERPDGLTLLRILVVCGDLPLHVRRSGLRIRVVDTSSRGTSLRRRLRRDGRLRGEHRLVHVHTGGTQLTEEAALLRNSVVVLERDGDRSGGTLWSRGPDLGLYSNLAEQ